MLGDHGVCLRHRISETRESYYSQERCECGTELFAHISVLAMVYGESAREMAYKLQPGRDRRPERSGFTVCKVNKG